jgi:DNA-binding NarL/FixJ family response regulator
MAPRRARIVLADHQPLFRQSLAALLRGAGHEIAAEAGNGDELDRALIDAQPDVLIVERHLPGLESLSYIENLHALQPQILVLLLVAYETEARSLQSSSFLAGASGCLSKDQPAAAFIQGVRRLMDGSVLYEPDVMRRAARPPTLGGPLARLRGLTGREQEILALVSEGLGNREIAERLGISQHTTMKHVSNIISKLQVNNRMEAGLLYLKHGIGGILPARDIEP